MTAISIGETTIQPGERKRFSLQIAKLPSDDWISMPLEVINGPRSGPTIWLSGAIHGDEIMGVEIVRRVLRQIETDRLRGCLIGVPIVNVFGFVDQSRNLPDRRDLNRCFPGSANGSLASRLANRFMKEIVSHCSYGIDLHTGSNHRQNLPQIRANLSDPETMRCAQAFGAPIIIDAKNRDGSLRQAALARGIHCLLYEAGQPMRFDDSAINIGQKGILRVLAALRMYGKKKKLPKSSLVCGKSSWLRSRNGGILRLRSKLGDKVKKGDIVGEVGDAFGAESSNVVARKDGIVIGITNNPLVYQGDAIVHVAEYETEFSQPDEPKTDYVI